MDQSEEIDLELIAAYIDGRASQSERDQVVRLLGRSEAAFEVYAEAIKAKADVADGTVVPIRSGLRAARPRWLTIAAPAAAAAILLIALVPVLRSSRSEPDIDDARSAVAPLLAQAPTTVGAGRGYPMELRNALRPGWEDHWSALRGGRPTLVDSTTALRLGVRTNDLRVALSLADREVSARVTDDIMSLLGDVQLSELVAHDYARLRDRIVSGDSMAAIVADASVSEKGLDELLGTPWFAMGNWFGAGEVAARAHYAPFFTARRTVDFLDWAASSQLLTPTDRDLIREITRLSNDGMRESDYETVRQKFAELILRRGG